MEKWSLGKKEVDYCSPMSLRRRFEEVLIGAWSFVPRDQSAVRPSIDRLEDSVSLDYR
jgi:hypothetical protein